MNSLCGNEFLSGPFDACIECEYLCNGCSGPRTPAMPLQRWIVWIKSCMKRFGVSSRALAEGTNLSKSTVDDILAGRRKDISRETCCLIENFVLGAGKWPCARSLSSGTDVIYEDRPETLEALRVAAEESSRKDATIAELQRTIKESGARHDADIKRVQDYYEDNIKEYKELVAHMRRQVNRKDDYIDRLAKKAGL